MSGALPSAQDFPSNTNASREPAKRPRAKSVISGKPIVKEPSLGSKIRETFTVEAGKTIGEYILFEVVIPNVKSMILDSVTQGLERRFYGEGRGSVFSPGRTSSSGITNYVPYNRMYKRQGLNASGPRDISRQAKATHDFNEVIIANRGEAEKVLDAMVKQLADYDVVTVYDFYDMVNIRGDFTDEKYGWNDLRGANIRRVRDGYLIVLPPPIPLD